jgi:hypothetical protein
LHPSDGEFERFLEQIELEISKSKERRHKTAHPTENLQNCRPKEEFTDRKKCKNESRKFQSQNYGPKSKNCELQFCPAITFSTPECSNSTQTSSNSPKVELKPLPSTLRYEYLGPNESYPVIINAALNEDQTDRLLFELRTHQAAIGYKIEDLKGISPSIYMHRILMEDDHKPTAEAQRRLNPNLKEVVWKEIHKLLDAGIIYPISDSKWVSPVHVVPKKGGTTVVKSADGELLSTRTATGWRMCIDYRKLNSATRKDHFPLPFIDQMLERLAKHLFFYYLDGYSGSFKYRYTLMTKIKQHSPVPTVRSRTA